MNRPFTQTDFSTSHPMRIWMLVLTLIFAQWLGLTHNILHTPWSKSTPHASSVLERAVENTSHHSCATFDHATLSAAIYTLPFCLNVLPSKQILALWQAFASWNAPFVCHFLSRAPPGKRAIP